MSQIVSMNKDDALTALSKGEISIEQFSELFTIKEKKPPKKRGRQLIQKEKTHQVLSGYIAGYCEFHKAPRKLKQKEFFKDFVEHNIKFNSGQIGRRRIEEYLEICNSFERRSWPEITSNMLKLENDDDNRIFIRKQIGDFYSFFHWVLMEAFQELQFSTCKCDKREGFCTLHPFGGVGNLYEYFFDFIFEIMWLCHHLTEDEPSRKVILMRAAILIRGRIISWHQILKINHMEIKSNELRIQFAEKS